VKRLLALVMAAVPAAVFGVVSPAQAALPVFYFSRIQYDSPGSDTRSAASLNAEWFKLTNSTTRPQQLRNFSVKDAAGKTYKFAVSTVVAPKSSIVVHTGRGSSGAPNSWDRYWGSGNYIWNNPGDTAKLYTPSGAVLDSCKWTRVSPGATNC